MGSSTFPLSSAGAAIPSTVLGAAPAGLTLRNSYTSSTSGLSFPVSMVYAIVIGGGGGGGGYPNSPYGYGGGAGGLAQGWIPAPTSVTVGAGGAGGANSYGGTGGMSQAGYLVAGGGGGGMVSNGSVTAGGAGGVNAGAGGGNYTAPVNWPLMGSAGSPPLTIGISGGGGQQTGSLINGGGNVNAGNGVGYKTSYGYGGGGTSGNGVAANAGGGGLVEIYY